MKTIPLTKGAVCYVDDEDFERYGYVKWYLIGDGYACRDVRDEGIRKCLYLHRMIAEATPEQHVHHIDGNRLHNWRSNLAKMTNGEHRLFHEIRRGPKKGEYKGVVWNTRNQHWKALIQVDNVRACLGAYETAEEAAQAYDKAAFATWGEVAFLNLPHLLYEPAPQSIPKHVPRNEKRPEPGRYKGVSFDRFRNKWSSQTHFKGRPIHFGRFDTAEEAARVYDRNVRLLRGSGVYLNFPEDDTGALDNSG